MVVKVKVEVMADWKFSRIQSEEEKRVWKYGEAARNMFLEGGGS
jgi:hypothetical protein